MGASYWGRREIAAGWGGVVAAGSRIFRSCLAGQGPGVDTLRCCPGSHRSQFKLSADQHRITGAPGRLAAETGLCLGVQPSKEPGWTLETRRGSRFQGEIAKAGVASTTAKALPGRLSSRKTRKPSEKPEELPRLELRTTGVLRVPVLPPGNARRGLGAPRRAPPVEKGPFLQGRTEILAGGPGPAFSLVLSRRVFVWLPMRQERGEPDALNARAQ